MGLCNIQESEANMVIPALAGKLYRGAIKYVEAHGSAPHEHDGACKEWEAKQKAHNAVIVLL